MREREAIKNLLRGCATDRERLVTLFWLFGLETREREKSVTIPATRRKLLFDDQDQVKSVVQREGGK